MKGGGFVPGLGTLLSKATGKELTIHQKAKELAYGKLKSFSEYGYYDFKVDDEFGNKPELVAFAARMINGYYGLINIQTENDVIALRRLYVKFKKDNNADIYRKMPGMDKTPLQQEWIAAASPEPILGDIMKNGKGILEKAGKKGLLRTTFNPQAGSPEDTDEARNAVMTLNEADQARTTASISAAEYSNTIGSITYDASPYNTTPEKKKGFFSGGRKSRKNRKNKSRKNRKNKSRKN